MEDKSRSVPGRLYAFREGPSTASITPGSQDVKALCVITPAALGPQYFRACAEVIDATAGGAPDLIRCPTDIPSNCCSCSFSGSVNAVILRPQVPSLRSKKRSSCELLLLRMAYSKL